MKQQMPPGIPLAIVIFAAVTSYARVAAMLFPRSAVAAIGNPRGR